MMSSTNNLVEIDQKDIEFDAHAYEAGAGSFGCVWFGYHKVRKKWVAVKIFHVIGGLQEKTFIVNKINKEMGHLQKVEHHNIVRVLGWVKLDSAMGIVMEYHKNGSIKCLLLDRSIPLTVVLRVWMLLSIAKALACCHTLPHKYLVHGDVKPDNILIAALLICKLCDFGTAELITRTGSRTVTSSDRSKNDKIQYTPWYTAPEKLKDLGKKPTKAMDVYAFALLIHMFLSRDNPYASGNDKALLDAIKDGLRPNCEAINEWKSTLDERDGAIVESLEDIMKLCWKQNPSERPSMTEVCEKLETLLDGQHESVITQQATDTLAKMEEIYPPPTNLNPQIPLDVMWARKNSPQEQYVPRRNEHRETLGDTTRSSASYNPTAAEQNSQMRHRPRKEQTHNHPREGPHYSGTSTEGASTSQDYTSQQEKATKLSLSWGEFMTMARSLIVTAIFQGIALLVTVTESTMPVTLHSYRALCECDVISRINRDLHNEVEIRAEENAEENSWRIRFKGWMMSVEQAKAQISSAMMELTTRPVFDMGSRIEYLLSALKSDRDGLQPGAVDVRQVIQEEFKGRQIHASLQLKSDEVCLVYCDPKELQKARQALTQIVQQSTIAMKEGLQEVINTQEWMRLIQNVSFSGAVQVYVNASRSSIDLVGLTQAFRMAFDDVHNYVGDNVVVTRTFHRRSFVIKFLRDNMDRHKDSKKRLKDVKLVYTPKYGFVTVKGKTKKVIQVINWLKEATSELAVVEKSIQDPGMPEYFRSRKGREHIVMIAVRNHCRGVIDAEDEPTATFRQSSSTAKTELSANSSAAAAAPSQYVTKDPYRQQRMFESEVVRILFCAWKKRDVDKAFDAVQEIIDEMSITKVLTNEAVDNLTPEDEQDLLGLMKRLGVLIEKTSKDKLTIKGLRASVLDAYGQANDIIHRFKQAYHIAEYVMWKYMDKNDSQMKDFPLKANYELENEFKRNERGKATVSLGKDGGKCTVDFAKMEASMGGAVVKVLRSTSTRVDQDNCGQTN